jgi:hypothetical protein
MVFRGEPPVPEGCKDGVERLRWQAVAGMTPESIEM